MCESECDFVKTLTRTVHPRANIIMLSRWRQQLIQLRIQLIRQRDSCSRQKVVPLSHRYSYLAHEYSYPTRRNSYPTPVLAIPTSVLAVVRAVSVVFLLLFLGRYSKRPNIPNIIFASRCDTAHYKSLFFYRPTIIPNMIPTMKGNIF